MIQAGLEYDPQLPFGPMDWSRADVDVFWSRRGRGDAVARRAYFTPLLQDRPDVLAKMLA